ncbi:lysine N(6)-hydroxylase/L-ornithine N(5)-oxygenase family protein, partial [Streptomyces caniscabiei]|uniref:lysine N(6)-hydroxylase/L-ornithine N(5)-oxygenase family protein n=1 Tax=Streptomyces caniscabiei TaxID=2746961 RepID=UPI00211B6E67
MAQGHPPQPPRPAGRPHRPAEARRPRKPRRRTHPRMSTTPAHDQPDPEAPRDLVGIGIGPANLSLAALAHPLAELDAVFYERRPGFDWH